MVVKWAMDISSDPGCSRMSDTDMALGGIMCGNMGLGITMDSDVNVGHPHQPSPQWHLGP